MGEFLASTMAHGLSCIRSTRMTRALYSPIWWYRRNLTLVQSFDKWNHSLSSFQEQIYSRQHGFDWSSKHRLPEIRLLYPKWTRSESFYLWEQPSNLPFRILHEFLQRNERHISTLYSRIWICRGLRLLDRDFILLSTKHTFKILQFHRQWPGPVHGDSRHFEIWTKIFHCPTSSGASERASEQRSERCKRMSEWMSKWPCTNIPISRCPESLCCGQTVKATEPRLVLNLIVFYSKYKKSIKIKQKKRARLFFLSK